MAPPAALLRHAAKAHEQAAAESLAAVRDMAPHARAMVAPIASAIAGASDYQAARKAVLRACKRPTPAGLAPALRRRLERAYGIGEQSAAAETT